MCGPEGTAVFYCRKQVQDKLQLRQYGWHMLQNPFGFAAPSSKEPKSKSSVTQSEEIQIADSAQRFESGSPNMMGIAALNASLGLLLDIGIENIQQKIATNVDYLLTKLQAQNDITILSPLESDRYAGIVTFVKNTVDNEKLYQHLQKNNVICAARGGGIRFSPHFHTEIRQLEAALQIVFDFSA
jgi:selenocysteine lyase/cysteine desulfurase